jgi:hypothetical protein
MDFRLLLRLNGHLIRAIYRSTSFHINTFHRHPNQMASSQDPLVPVRLGRSWGQVVLHHQGMLWNIGKVALVEMEQAHTLVMLGWLYWKVLVQVYQATTIWRM